MVEDYSTEKNEKSWSTVIVTGRAHSQVHSFKINTKHVKRWKVYLCALTCLLTGLLIAVISLSFYIQGHNLHTMRLAEQVKNLKNLSPAKNIKVSSVPLLQDGLEVNDTMKAQIYISNIQEKIRKIDRYLRKRGIKGFSSLSIGGNHKKNTPHFSPQERLKLYDEYLLKLFNNLKFTPLGYPHGGNTSSSFGYRTNPFDQRSEEFHAGVDFRGSTGEKVKCTAGGKVIWANWFQGYGKCVRIVHEDGYQTLYGHLSEILVKQGQKVQAGEMIGNIGSTGHSTGPHLHYEVRRHNNPINPNQFFSL